LRQSSDERVAVALDDIRLIEVNRFSPLKTLGFVATAGALVVGAVWLYVYLGVTGTINDVSLLELTTAIG
jgi:hypothetical protein